MSASTSRRTGTTLLTSGLLSASTSVSNAGPATVQLSNGTQLAASASTTVLSSSGLRVTVPAGSYADITVDPGPDFLAGLSGGSGGTVTFGTTSGTAAEGNDSRIVGAAQKASNLSDLASASTARTNLGLGTAATQATGAFDAAGAAAAVLPTQTGHSGQYLTTNGTAASWSVVSGGSVNINGGNATSTYAANIDGGQAA